MVRGPQPTSIATLALVVALVSIVGGAHHQAAKAQHLGARLEPLSAETPVVLSKPRPEDCLRPARLKEAKRFAASRDGSVAFAFRDECDRIVGDHANRVYSSASVVKVMLLAAYLRRDDVADDDPTGEERDMLTAMITASDNDAADQVFAIVGPDGLNDVAEAAGMRNFSTGVTWGASQITAADQASFLGDLERYVPTRHEAFAMKLTASITSSQRWGLADVSPKGWNLHFKGGWYPDDDGWRVHQVATLRRHGRSFALAVLTSQNPSFQYGRETIAGVGKRLMADYRAESARR